MKDENVKEKDALIRADGETVKRLGLTHGKIAARMAYFRDKGNNGLGTPVRVAPHFEVTCDAARGFLSCPFGDIGRIRKTNVTCRNLRLGMEITYSDLNIHLIAEHGYYEDRSSPFRMDPAPLAKVLEIQIN